MIRAKKIIKKYDMKSDQVVATNSVSLNFEEKGLYMILGKSGCGKTTLLNILGGLDACDSGNILIDNDDMRSFSEKKLDQYHNLNMGVIFQEFNLISEISVYDNLRIALEIQKWTGKNNDEISKIISSTLEIVGSKGYEKRKISELSGGERQRIAIARVIIKEPKIIFADEPTGNLDDNTSKMIFELLKQLSKFYIVIVVTHDRESAYRYADTVINIENGCVAGVEKQDVSKYSMLYSADMIKNNKVMSLHQVTYDEFCRKVMGLIEQSDEKGDIKINHIITEENVNSENSGKTENIMHRKDKEVQKLPFKYRLQLAAKFLKKKKFSFFMTILLMTISTILLYMAGAITFYKDEEVITTYLEKYKPEKLPISIEKAYEDSFFEKHTVNLTKGNYLDNIIGKKFDNTANLLEATYSNYVYSEEAETDIEVTIIYINDQYNINELVGGKMPQSDNEVMITDYVASELGIAVGDSIYYNKGKLDVVGIVKTNYVEYNLKSKLQNGITSPFFDYLMTYKYLVMYMKNSYLHGAIKNKNVRIELPKSDFTMSKRERSYMERSVFYDSETKLDAQYLVEGRLPEKRNEVVVSEAFATDFMGYIPETKFTEKRYNFLDIYSNIYNNCYTSELNMYDYYTEGIKVVGIVSNFEDDELSSAVYVEEGMWSRVKNDYYDYYAADKIYVVKDDNYAQFTKVASDNNIMINEPAVLQIYEFSKLIDKMKVILYIILILTMILNAVMLITFIQISMRENRKNIGILRALGVPMKVTGSIFEIEFWVIYILSIILSVPIILYIQKVSNSVYAQGIIENPYDIIRWDMVAFIAVIVIEAIIGVIASYAPIKKYNDKKIIELLR